MTDPQTGKSERGSGESERQIVDNAAIFATTGGFLVYGCDRRQVIETGVCCHAHHHCHLLGHVVGNELDEGDASNAC